MSKKTILINAMMINDKPTGLGVYAINLLKELLPMLSDFQITLVVNSIPENMQFSKVINLIEIDQSNFIKRNYQIKKCIENSTFDIYYSLSQHYFKNRSLVTIITIHDLIPLLYPEGRLHQHFYYKYLLPFYLKKTNKVITVSNSTKDDIIKYYGYDNVEVVYCGSNYSKSIVNYNSEKKNYLMVGIHYPYKNLHFVIKTFSKIANNTNDNLIIIGNKNCKYGQYLQKLIDDFNMKDRIKMLGFVSEETKVHYYQNSKALIFPSKYEGFGLPIIEAMSFGIPVLCSNSSSLPEVGNSAAVYFENDNEKSLLNALNSIEDKNRRDKLIEKGYKNIERFNWKKTADEIYNIINRSIL